jgi:hypothetical protein
VRQVDEGRQQAERLDRTGGGQLRDLQYLLHDLLAVAGADIDVGEGAMRGAQIDADRKFWLRS